MPKTVHAFVYLASQSPRRRQLLAQIGVAHELLLPGPEEDAEGLEAVRPGELPQAYVQRVTQAKLLEARARMKARGLPPAPILCADTTVAVGRRILGKPADAAQALAMLQQLSGRSHRVLSAVAVWDGRRTHAAMQISRVRVAPLAAPWLHSYIASGEPFGKAGAYGIQGAMGAKVQAIAGSYSGIMGLPLFEAAALLERAGVLFGTATGST